jgi:hypothetical protein
MANRDAAFSIRDPVVAIPSVAIANLCPAITNRHPADPNRDPAIAIPEAAFANPQAAATDRHAAITNREAAIPNLPAAIINRNAENPHRVAAFPDPATPFANLPGIQPISPAAVDNSGGIGSGTPAEAQTPPHIKSWHGEQGQYELVPNSLSPPMCYPCPEPQVLPMPSPRPMTFLCGLQSPAPALLSI